MADLIPDTGARGENTQDNPDDAQNIGQGHAQAPGGGDTSPQDARDMTQGQESYPGDRPAGESDRSVGPTDREGNTSNRDAATNNAATPVAGDTDPGSTDDADATGMAGVNDRPGKDKAHPWNG